MPEGSSQPKYVWPPRGDDAEPTAEVHHVLNMNEEDLEDVDKVNQAIELLHAEHGQNPEARSTIRKAIQEVRERLQNKAKTTGAANGPTRLLAYDGEPARSAEYSAHDTVTGEPVTAALEEDSANFHHAPINREDAVDAEFEEPISPEEDNSDAPAREGVPTPSREDAIDAEFEESGFSSADGGGADRGAEAEPLVSIDDTVEARENSTQPDDVVGFGREYPEGGVSGGAAPVEESDDAEAAPADLDLEHDEEGPVAGEGAEAVQATLNYEQAAIMPTIEAAGDDEGHTAHREGGDEAHPALNAEEEHRVAAGGAGRNNHRPHAPHRPTNGHNTGNHAPHAHGHGTGWFGTLRGIWNVLWTWVSGGISKIRNMGSGGGHHKKEEKSSAPAHH